MTIADAPLWAQNPTAEVRRNLAYDEGNRVSTEPFWVDLVWLHTGDTDADDTWGSIMGVETPGGMSIPEARRLWEALGELLAIEAADPATAIVAPGPWSTDTDGSRTRMPSTPDVPTGARNSDGVPIVARVELYERQEPNAEEIHADTPEVRLLTENGDGIPLASANDARALAFALFKAAHVADLAAGVTP
jgi:hypothetical protein